MEINSCDTTPGWKKWGVISGRKGGPVQPVFSCFSSNIIQWWKRKSFEDCFYFLDFILTGLSHPVLMSLQPFYQSFICRFMNVSGVLIFTLKKHWHKISNSIRFKYMTGPILALKFNLVKALIVTTLHSKFYPLEYINALDSSPPPELAWTHIFCY